MDHGRVIAPYYTHCPPLQSQPQPPHAARVTVVPYHGAPNLQAPDLLQPYHHPYQPMGNSAPYQPRTMEAFPPPPPHSLDHGGAGVAASTAAANSGRVSRSGASIKYAYFLDRGDGKVTRLVPADMLPPLAGILSQEPLGPGMQILPSLYGKPPSGVQAMNAPVIVKVRCFPSPFLYHLLPPLVFYHFSKMRKCIILPWREKEEVKEKEKEKEKRPC